MIEVREYVDGRGRSPFGRWFDDLDAGAALRVRTTLARMEAGNLSKVRGAGGGVLECPINVGPGYRVYFGRDGNTLIVLLGGGANAPAERHRGCPCTLARVQAPQAAGGVRYAAHP